MFPTRFFSPRFHAAHYFPAGGETLPPIETVSLYARPAPAIVTAR